MAIFFQIAINGESVYVAKTISNKSLDQEQFDKKAKQISIDKFISKLTKEEKEKFETIINQIKEIEKQDLAFLAHSVHFRIINNFEFDGTNYVIDNRQFKTTYDAYKYGEEQYGTKYMLDNGYLQEDHTYQIGNRTFNSLNNAYNYGVTIYGKEFMDKHKHLLKNPDSEHVFIKGKKITNVTSIDEAKRIIVKQNKLCKITNLKDLLKTNTRR